MVRKYASSCQITRSFVFLEAVVMEFKIRSATKEDYPAVLEMSEGHYEGHDDMPLLFKQWLQRDNIAVLIATYAEKAIGLCAVCIVDEGQTFFSRGLRIHPLFRGKGFGTKFILAVRQFVRDKYPNVLCERYTTANTHRPRLAIAAKTGDKLLYEQDSYAFVVKRDKFQVSQLDLNASCLSLVRKYDVQEFKEALHRSQELFKQGIMLIDYSPYKATPSNVNLCIEQGDYLFTDVPQSDQLCSFSHGRINPTAKFTQWVVSLFATDVALFKAHLLINLKVACQNIQEDIVFRISHDRNKLLKDTAVKLLHDTLELEIENLRFDDFRALLFEKKLY